MKNRISKFQKYISENLYFIAYIIIAILIILGFTALLFLHIDNTTKLAEENLRAIGMEISSIAKNAVDHTSILRHEAQLNIDEPASYVPQELFTSLTKDPNGDKYELLTLPPNYSKDSASYILGGGEIPADSSIQGQEIKASIKLNPLFYDIKQNIPQATWIYYYSLNRFINMYPFGDQVNVFTWSDDWLVHPLFLSVHPKQDPFRAVLWYKAYIDEAGKGLMTSVVAPVYDKKNQFRGMVGMDFTLKTMNSYITGTNLGIGTPILVNQHGQILADPDIVHSDDKTVKKLSEVLPSELKGYSEKILTQKEGRYYDILGWKIYVLDISSAPWRLLFIVNKNKLFWNTIGGMWAELTGMLLMLIIIGFFEHRQRIAQKLRTYKAAVDSSSAAIVITDSNSRIQYINKSFIEITGYSEKETIGQKLDILISERIYPEGYTNLKSALDASENWNDELLTPKKDGTLIWVNVSISPVAENKDSGCCIAIIEDITEHKQMLESLNKSATIDELTNIANRNFFLSIAEREFEYAEINHKLLSVIMLDIDHFKQVNDTYGHAAGDLVLQRFASKCSELLNHQDCFGRIGGEEFAILLPETDQKEAWEKGEQIRKEIEMLETITPDGSKIKITCSIGVAQKKEDDHSFQYLLTRSDTALYEAKNSGRNRVLVK